MAARAGGNPTLQAAEAVQVVNKKKQEATDFSVRPAATTNV